MSKVLVLDIYVYNITGFIYVYTYTDYIRKHIASTLAVKLDKYELKYMALLYNINGFNVFMATSNDQF